MWAIQIFMDADSNEKTNEVIFLKGRPTEYFGTNKLF